VDLSAYAELAVRLANTAADGEEETCGGDDVGNIFGLDGLHALLTDLEFPDTRATRTDLDAMRRLRIEFREIFAACAAGNGTEAVDRLNALLIQHPVHPQISAHDGQPWHLHLTQSGCVADRYAAGSAMGLATMVTRLGADRLRLCGAPSCQGVFIDTTTDRSRRYCSERCASRANVTAFRTRRTAGPPDVLPTAAV
jgi:predicted RNA-binding Zn ribbon-like protein